MTKTTNEVLRILGILALIAWLAYTLWLVRFTLVYILVSAVIALMGKPLVDLLSGERWPKLNFSRSIGAAITLMLLGAIMVGILSIFVPALLVEARLLSQIDFESFFNELYSYWQEVQIFLGLSADQTSGNLDNSMLRPGLIEMLNIENVTDTFGGLVGSLGNLAFAAFSILFISFFFMREKFLFRNIILALIPESYEQRVQKVSPRLRNTLARYFIGLLFQVSIITLVISVGLKLMGFQNTVVIGFFAGLINVIPYLGPIIGMAFGLVIGLSQIVTGSVDLSLAVGTISIVSLFAGMQLTDNFILQPFIFSTSIRAHPLEIFLVISFAATLAGVAGMIVAVPVYSVVRLLAGEFLSHLKFVRWLTQSSLNDSEEPS